MKKMILMDVEGTTTSISFVHDVLFPYSKDNLINFLEKEFNNKVIWQRKKEGEGIIFICLVDKIGKKASMLVLIS